jgi:hypothetical protein
VGRRRKSQSGNTDPIRARSTGPNWSFIKSEKRTQTNINQGRGRQAGDKQQYTPEQTDRYKSQYLRYVRAIENPPPFIQGQNYLFLSDRAPQGYWEVTPATLPTAWQTTGVWDQQGDDLSNLGAGPGTFSTSGDGAPPPPFIGGQCAKHYLVKWTESYDSGSQSIVLNRRFNLNGPIVFFGIEREGNLKHQTVRSSSGEQYVGQYIWYEDRLDISNQSLTIVNPSSLEPTGESDDCGNPPQMRVN